MARTKIKYDELIRDTVEIIDSLDYDKDYYKGEMSKYNLIKEAESTARTLAKQLREIERLLKKPGMIKLGV